MVIHFVLILLQRENNLNVVLKQRFGKTYENTIKTIIRNNPPLGGITIRRSVRSHYA